jgi:hypothetical protein
VQDRIFPGVGHIGLVIAIAPLFQGKAPVLPVVEAFIRSHRLDRTAPAGAGAQAAE